ncbi:MAG TPA: lipoyl(octanoyl) transferase LipB [Longimicrobiales bacterium]|jgi:lipoyl(octanoyl) transferase
MVSAPSDRPTLEARYLGRIDYAHGLTLQEDLVRERRAGRTGDVLLLLEHPHVITLGSSSDPAHVLMDAASLERRGIEVHRVGRGGDVTYHGPGQLVGYLIVDLKPDRQDLHRFLRDVEGALIRAMTVLGVRAERRQGLTGVWARSGKLAAIGVRVSSGWITSHGFALNVNTDLTFFEAIVPCGIADRAVSSLERELGRAVPLEEVMGIVASAFADAFGRDLRVLC